MSSLLFVNPNGAIWSQTIHKLSLKISDVRIFGIASPDFRKSLNCPYLATWINSIDFASTNYAKQPLDSNSLSPFQQFLRQDTHCIHDLISYVYPHIELLLRHRTGLNWNEHEILETIMLYISQSLYFLEFTNPSLVIFGTTPHAGWDNVFLLLCERLGINYIFNEPSLIFPFSYMSCGVPGKNANPVCRSEYISSDLSSNSLTQLERTIDSLKRQNLSRRFLPNYLRGFVKFEPFSLFNSFCSTLYGLCLTSIDPVLSVGSLHKYRDLPYGSSVSLFGRLLFYTSLFLRILCAYAQSRKFICRAPLSYIFKKPFIAYFPPFQIEFTSLPSQGLDFSQQACIHRISACMPPEFNLYVKDHPWTFSFVSSSLTSRSPSFYRSLAKYSVRFLPSNVSPFRIFSDPNCRGVVNNGSTVALEAMALGVPVYETCHTYLTPLSCVRSIRDLLQPYQANPSAINPLEEYKSYLEKYCFEFWTGEHEYLLNDELIDVYSNQMSDFLQSYYESISRS
jgi:hypothetical protein